MERNVDVEVRPRPDTEDQADDGLCLFRYSRRSSFGLVRRIGSITLTSSSAGRTPNVNYIDAEIRFNFYQLFEGDRVRHGNSFLKVFIIF